MVLELLLLPHSLRGTFAPYCEKEKTQYQRDSFIYNMHTTPLHAPHPHIISSSHQGQLPPFSTRCIGFRYELTGYDLTENTFLNLGSFQLYQFPLKFNTLNHTDTKPRTRRFQVNARKSKHRTRKDKSKHKKTTGTYVQS